MNNKDNRFGQAASTENVGREQQNKCVVKLTKLSQEYIDKAQLGRIIYIEKEVTSNVDVTCILRRSNRLRKIPPPFGTITDFGKRGPKKRIRSPEKTEIPSGKRRKLENKQSERSAESSVVEIPDESVNKRENERPKHPDESVNERPKHPTESTGIFADENNDPEVEFPNGTRSKMGNKQSKRLAESSENYVVETYIRTVEIPDKSLNKREDERPKHLTKSIGISVDENYKQTETTSNELALPDFTVGDVVWAKISGHPNWPAKVERIYGCRLQMAEILWFNDYRRSKVYKSQLQRFLPNLQQHSKLFDGHIGLETAAKEAMLYIASKMNNSLVNRI